MSSKLSAYLFYLVFGLSIFFTSSASAQGLDSLKLNLSNAKDDYERYLAFTSLYNYYEESNRDSALYYAGKELEITKSNHHVLAQVLSLNHKGYQLNGLGRYAEALQCLLDAFEIVNDRKNAEDKWLPVVGGTSIDHRRYMDAYTHHIFAILMWTTQNVEQEIYHFKEARRIGKEIGHTVRQQMASMNLSRSYLRVNLDSALFYGQESLGLVPKSGFTKYVSQNFYYLGNIYLQKGDKEKAKEYYHLGVSMAKKYQNLISLSSNYFALATIFVSDANKDSALFYSLKNLEVYKSIGAPYGPIVNYGTIYQHISQAYQLNGQTDSAYKYQGLALTRIDSLDKVRIRNLTDFQNLSFNDQLRLKNIEKDKVIYQNRVKTWLFTGGLSVLLLLAIIFYRNNLQKQKAKQKIEKAYDELKATQQQLVHSEKMASLGELTAGIAHEIQNPLNFVNNFSEVNRELVVELKEQLEAGNSDAIIEIADDIAANEEKINHHGKRADAIVKNMLLHSNAGTGKKEPTDINAMAEEYLRLAYHGLRAKDKSFNAKLETSLDPALGKVDIMPQEFGRVLLNLINNALHAVDEKRKLSNGSYEPTVSVMSKFAGNAVEIKIADNGIGIGDKNKDKIFQPFFTTKATGQGTGLGLSLSYDIIKAHGGEIKVISREGEGAEFIIRLPNSK